MLEIITEGTLDMGLTDKSYEYQEATPPTPQQSTPAMRIGRAEREAVVKVLNDAYLEDRIFPHEHDERLGKALQATTQEELNSIIRDLVVIAPPPPKPPVFSLEKVEKPSPSTVRTADDLPRGGWSLWEVFVTVCILSILVTITFPFAMENSSENFSKLENHINDVSAILTNEALRTNEPLTLTAGEGLGTIRTANNEPLPSTKSEEIENALIQHEDGLGEKWNVTSDGALLTFTTSYGFVLSNDVTCTLDVAVPVGEEPVKNCTVE